jgi:hypothetical protein
MEAQGQRTALVLLLTVVGAVLVGSFVVSSWAHSSALPVAGRKVGDFAEITTAYKTYTQTLYVMDSGDLEEAFDKAADGNIGANGGEGSDFEAVFTSPPVSAGTLIKKSVTKHVFKFPKDYPKIEKMQEDKSEESQNIRKILKSVDKAIKQHADECGSNKACENKPFQVVIEKVHRIYNPKNKNGLAHKISMPQPGRHGVMYVRIAEQIDDVTPQFVHKFSNHLAHELGISHDDILVTLHPGSVVLEVMVKDPKIDGHALVVAYKAMVIADMKKCAHGDKIVCEKLMNSGVRILGITLAKPIKVTHPPHHEKAGQHTGEWHHEGKIPKNVAAEAKTYPPGHAHAGKPLSAEDLHKEFVKSLKTMKGEIDEMQGKLTNEQKAKLDAMQKELSGELSSEMGKMSTGMTGKYSHMMKDDHDDILNKMTAQERAEHTRLLKHEQEMMAKMSDEEKKELADMQKKWDNMSKEQQEAFMARWARKLQKDEIGLRTAAEKDLSKEDALRMSEWHKMSDEQKRSTRELMRRLMRRESRQIDRREHSAIHRLKHAMQHSLHDGAGAAAPGSQSVIVLTYPPHHEKAGQSYTLRRMAHTVRAGERAEKEHLLEAEQHEQRRLRKEERRNRRAERQDMKWQMSAMQKAMSKAEKDSIKDMEHNEAHMEKSFMQHMGKMYKDYKAKMLSQTEKTSEEAQKAAAELHKMAKHPIVLTYPPHHENAGMALPPHMQPFQPCTATAATPCGAISAPVAPAMPCNGIATPTGCAPQPVQPCLGCQPAQAGAGCIGQTGVQLAVCQLQRKVQNIWQKAQPLLASGSHGLAG